MRFVLFPDSCEVLKFSFRARVDDFSAAWKCLNMRTIGFWIFLDVVSVNV